MLGLSLPPRRRPTELQPLGQSAGSTVAAVEMESKQISANEADEILQKWVTQSQRVCFAVCVGGIAWHSHWVGTLRSASMGRWVLTAGHTTNKLCTTPYQENIPTEGDHPVGRCFAPPHGFPGPGLAGGLFFARHDGHPKQYMPVVKPSK